MTIGRDEADIVALAPDRRTLVIVEVKTRRAERPSPEEQVGRAKRRHLLRLAGRLASSAEAEGRPIRLDVIAIVWPERGRPTVRHHEAAVEG